MRNAEQEGQQKLSPQEEAMRIGNRRGRNRANKNNRGRQDQAAYTASAAAGAESNAIKCPAACRTASAFAGAIAVA